MKTTSPLRDLLWAAPLSLALGYPLAIIQPGNILIGWLLFSFLFLLSFYAMRGTQVNTHTGKQVDAQPCPERSRRDVTRISYLPTPNAQLTTPVPFLILYTAFLLRLTLGATFYLVLPLQPDAAEDHRAGYIYYDAYRRDTQAWELARSDQPLWSAFNKNFYSDQYGGLLALSAVSYRYLSPDAHRPLLPILLAALAATLGLPFLWKSAARLWDKRIARFAVWMYALYPESLLLGSSQMREPFLMFFMAMALWGFVNQRVERRAEQSGARSRNTLIWLILGFIGMLLISPIAALLTLIILLGWMFVQREHGRVSWIALLATGLVFIAGLYLLAWGLEREQPFGSSPFGVIMNWSREAVKWDVYQLERGSGWVQKLFGEMPEGLHPLFVMIYGLCQPVLPAAFVEPTTLTLRLLGIFRALGWYALVPLLFYAPFAAFRSTLFLSEVEGTGADRRLWLWLTAVVWLWSIASALRGGADQWDNPRYRAILIVIESLVAGFAWVNRDRWLIRWLAVEVVFLAFFTQWYASRYYHLGEQIPFGQMVALIFICAAMILGGGRWWDQRQARRM